VAGTIGVASAGFLINLPEFLPKVSDGAFLLIKGVALAFVVVVLLFLGEATGAAFGDIRSRPSVSRMVLAMVLAVVASMGIALSLVWVLIVVTAFL